MKLTLADIVEPRAYERERDEFRAHIVALKKRRRVGIGPHITLVFENRDTIRFQIQEMARVEKIFTDEGIQTELDIYNALLPGNGRLSATLFIELTSDELLREWLPKLVGIERAIELRFGDQAVVSIPENAHEAQLTRDEITAAVHYIEFQLDAAQLDALEVAETVELAVIHPEYQHASPLGPESVAELVADGRSGD